MFKDNIEHNLSALSQCVYVRLLFDEVPSGHVVVYINLWFLGGGGGYI